MPPDLRTPEVPSPALLRRWFQRQLTLLEEERAEEQLQSRLLLSKTPPRTLEKNGLALLGLGAASTRIGLGAKLLVELERPSAYHTSSEFPPHTFRPGDLAALVDNGADQSAGADEGVHGVVFRVTDNKITVAIGDKQKGRIAKEGGKDTRDVKTGESTKLKNGTEELELPERIRLVKITNEATYDRMEKAMETAARQLGVSIDEDSSKAKRAVADDSSADEEDVVSSSSSPASATSLLRALFGITKPIWKSLPLPLPPFNTKLNRSQLDTLEFALASQHFSLIHGPPGTGKTTTIVELIMQIVASGIGASTDTGAPSSGSAVSVLVCGASNLAVDNILERLIGNADHRDVFKKKSIGVTRLGHPARVLSGLYAATLDAQCSSSSEGQLVSDVAREINEVMAELKPPTVTLAGNKSARKAPRLKGAERRKRWEELKLLRKEYRRRERQVTSAVLDRARIVLATCHGAGGRQLAGREFDWVIIDEACQAVEASCWIPILKAREGGRLVLAGDHMQLPPTVKGTVKIERETKTGKKTTPKAAEAKDKAAELLPTTESADVTGSPDIHSDKTADDKEDVADDLNQSFAVAKLQEDAHRRSTLRPARSLETTLFSRLLGMYGPGVKALLSIQYRMTDKIMAFPNTELYEDKLVSHESCADISLSDLANFIEATDEEADSEDGLGLLGPVVFYDTAGCEYYEDTSDASAEQGSSRPSRLGSDSKSNSHEVEILIGHLHHLFKHGIKANQITVLAPYSAQISLLSSALKGRTFVSAHDNSVITGESIELGTVDSMQGREKDIVLLSLVRSNEKGEVGFLAQKKRLNVATTRAKRQLVLIGDSETIGMAQDTPDDFLANYMEWLDKHAFVESVVASM